MIQTCIVTPTPKLEESIAFYEKLDFHIVRNNEGAIAMAKDLIITILADRYARAGIQLSGNHWEEQVAQLNQQTQVHPVANGYILNDPNGVRIYLVHGAEAKIETPTKDLAPSALGNYAGVSLESTDMKATLEFYAILGFEVTMGSVDKGWLAIQNKDQLGISIMKPNTCPHLFFNPSLTFFNGQNNLKVIENIRQVQVPIAEEITYFNKEGNVDNIIVRDPGGYGFFIFNDG